MFTYIKMSAEEFNQKLMEGQDFSIVAPHDNFEISMLYKVLIDELSLVFDGKDYDKFDALCNYIYYDSSSEGRFFFDLSENPKYGNDKIAFYVVVHGSNEVEFDEDEGEFIEPVEDACLVSYNIMEEEPMQDTEDRDYEFDVHSHYKGLMKIDLREAIGMMMSNAIKKI